MAAAAGTAVLVAAAIGALHAPFARSLLMRAGGCPVARARMTPREMESARHAAAAAERGGAIAPARPTAGFGLETTSLADVHAWAARQRVDCEDRHPGLVVCSAVKPAALGLDAARGTIDELALGFDEKGRLVNETTLRTHLSPAKAASTARQIVGSLAAELGPAGARAGTFAASQLAGPPASSVSAVSYRYRDYVADVMAMNLPTLGPTLREHYMSASD